MISRRNAMTCVIAVAVAAAQPMLGRGEVSPSAAPETLSMLNGHFWRSASDETKMMYIRAAHEAVTATMPPKSRPDAPIGWTYEQMIRWIEGFYQSDESRLRVPVGLVYAFSRRAADGEPNETLRGEADAFLRRLAEEEPERQER